MGDEAHKMARMVKSIIESGAARSLPTGDLRTAAEMASGLLRKTLDAFARLDTKAAVAILKEDDHSGLAPPEPPELRCARFSLASRRPHFSP